MLEFSPQTVLLKPSGSPDRSCAVVKPSMPLSAILKVGADFSDSQISGNMIHARDGGFGVASLWPEGGLRRVSGPSQGAERQYRHGGFRSVRVRHVFHAERVLPLLPADAGGGPGPLELPNPVRDRDDSFRQLYPGHARRGGPRAARAVLSTHGATAA